MSQDRLLKTVIEALQDWWVSVGELAWVLAGVLLLVGIATLLLLLRWIGGGGLSRQTAFGFFSNEVICLFG